MLKFWTKNSKHFKFPLAAILGVIMLLSFAIYYIADKGAAVNHAYEDKVKLLTAVNGALPTSSDVTLTTELQGLKISQKIPTAIAAGGYNTQLLTSLLVFSILSIPMLIVQLSMGSNKNFIVSIVINSLTAVILLILFGLMVAAIKDLNVLNNKIYDADTLYAAQKKAVLGKLQAAAAKDTVLSWA